MTYQRDPDLDDLIKCMELHGHRCPYCKSGRVSSSLDDQHCLDCDKRFPFGSEYPSIASEDPNHSCRLCEKKQRQ